MNVFVELLLIFVCSIGAAVATGLVRSRPLPSRRVALSPRLADSAVLGMALAYLLVFGALSLLKYYALAAAERDLAQYDQLVWNSLNGRLMQGTIVLDAPLFFAKSFTPIMLAFVPLYALWDTPGVLLVVQSVAISLSGFPVYWLARERLGPGLALVLTATYYLSPAVQNMNLDEFHEITLAVPLLSLALYFLLRKRYQPFVITLAAALLVKEEIAIVALALGIYILLCQEARRLGIALIAFGGLSAFLLLQYVIPFFRGAQPGSFYYLARYGYLGQNLPTILVTLITRPDIVLQHLLIPGKIEYVLQLLVPMAFVPLAGIEIFILTFPTFAYTLLSDVPWQYSIRTAYPAPLVPLLFFAAIVGLQRLSAWSTTDTADDGKPAPNKSAARRWALGALMLTAAVLCYALQGQGPLARGFRDDIYALQADSFLKEALLRSIPRDAVVVAQNEFLAHVSGRQFVYEIPSIPNCRQADYMIADPSKDWYRVHQGYWDECLGSGYFSVALESNGFVIVKPRAPEHTRAATFGHTLTLLAYSVQPQVTMIGGMTLQPILLLRPDDPTWQSHQLVMQLVDAQGHVWSRQDRVVGEAARADQRQVGKPISDQYRLDLPVAMPAGHYEVTVGVHRSGSEDNVEAVDENGNALGKEVTLATVRIDKNKSSVTASELEIEQPHQADMQEMRLMGYVPPRETITAGELLQVGLYWRARAQPRADYLVAVQLRDRAGNIAFEHASQPANGTYPTKEWAMGEVMLDWHDFYLPKDLGPGEYQIVVALREGADQRVVGQTTLRSISVLR